jgi:galactokinase
MLTQLDLIEANADAQRKREAKEAAARRAEQIWQQLTRVQARLSELVAGAEPADEAEFGRLLAEKQRLEAEFWRARNLAIWG